MRLLFYELMTSGELTGDQVIVLEFALIDNKIKVVREAKRAKGLGAQLLKEPLYDFKEQEEVNKKDPKKFLRVLGEKYSGSYFRSQLIED